MAGWKRTHPSRAQQRRIITRYGAQKPKNVRFGKRSVSLTIGKRRVKYPYKKHRHVSTIGNWSHGKKPTIHIDRDVKRKNLKPLLVHEAVEQHLAEQRGLPYRSAHRVAERYERAYVTSRGKTWKSYQNSVLRTKR